MMDFVEYLSKELNIKKDCISRVWQELSSNQLYLINNHHKRYVAKRYANPIHGGIEIYILSKCLERKEIKAPVLLHVENHEKWGYWIVYEYISGKPLVFASDQISEENIIALWAEIGRQLNYFHNTNFISNIDCDGVEKQIIEKTEINFNAIMQKENIHFEAIHFLREHNDLLRNHSAIRTVIFDLTNKHLIVDNPNNHWELVGLIDFEQAKIGYIFRDFVFVYCDYFFSHPAWKDAFFDGYGVANDKDFTKLVYYFILQYALECGGILAQISPSNKEYGRILIENTMAKLVLLPL